MGIKSCDTCGKEIEADDLQEVVREIVIDNNKATPIKVEVCWRCLRKDIIE